MTVQTLPLHWRTFERLLRKQSHRCEVKWSEDDQQFVARLVGRTGLRGPNEREKVIWTATGDDPTVALNRLAQKSIGVNQQVADVNTTEKRAVPVPDEQPHSRPGGGNGSVSSVLDVLYPFAGPCAFCGFPDKRHRTADAIVERVHAGDSLASAARDYDISVEAAAAVVAHADKRRAQKKARWS